QALEERQLRDPFRAGKTERKACDAGAPSIGIRLQARKGGRVRLKGKHAEIPRDTAGEHGEQADIRAGVDDAIAIPDGDAVPEIALEDENLVVDVVGLVPVQMAYRRPIGQDADR